MPRASRARLARFKRSVVVTFSAAAAGSAGAGCGQVHEPSFGVPSTAGAGGAFAFPMGGSAGSHQGAGTSGDPPSETFMDPPDRGPRGVPPESVSCPASLPSYGTACLPSATPAQCQYGIVYNPCPEQYVARCIAGIWVIQLAPSGSCNPPYVPPPGDDVDAGVDDYDAGA